MSLFRAASNPSLATSEMLGSSIVGDPAAEGDDGRQAREGLNANKEGAGKAIVGAGVTEAARSIPVDVIDMGGATKR